jgi:hypothetical protein
MLRAIDSGPLFPRSTGVLGRYSHGLHAKFTVELDMAARLFHEI